MIMITVLVGLGLLFILSEMYQRKLSMGINMYEYSVDKKMDGFEIRNYKAAYFNTVKMEGSSYKESSSKGFRVLAGYIFGGNKQDKKISMTSPVVMDMKEDITMKFMVPFDEDPQMLPQPNSSRVKLELVPAKKVAAIRFGGYASDEIIREKAALLLKLLDQQGIDHKETYSFYGYNPPFQVTGRRNEVIIELN